MFESREHAQSGVAVWFVACKFLEVVEAAVELNDGAELELDEASEGAYQVVTEVAAAVVVDDVPNGFAELEVQEVQGKDTDCHCDDVDVVDETSVVGHEWQMCEQELSEEDSHA